MAETHLKAGDCSRQQVRTTEVLSLTPKTPERANWAQWFYQNCKSMCSMIKLKENPSDKESKLGWRDGPTRSQRLCSIGTTRSQAPRNKKETKDHRRSPGWSVKRWSRVLSESSSRSDNLKVTCHVDMHVTRRVTHLFSFVNAT